jgi:antitoxin HicB
VGAKLDEVFLYLEILVGVFSGLCFWYTTYNMKIHHYTAIFQKEPEGGYTVIIPSLRGCVTYGETIEEAQKAAKEAIESYLGSLAKDKKEVPSDINFVSTIDINYA